jgi:hypothetical protein
MQLFFTRGLAAFFTAGEVARLAGVPRNTVLDMTENGIVPQFSHEVVGRTLYSLDDVRKIMEALGNQKKRTIFYEPMMPRPHA